MIRDCIMISSDFKVHLIFDAYNLNEIKKKVTKEIIILNKVSKRKKSNGGVKWKWLSHNNKKEVFVHL